MKFSNLLFHLPSRFSYFICYLTSSHKFLLEANFVLPPMSPKNNKIQKQHSFFDIKKKAKEW
jgi:hypothetical protein